MLLLLSLLLPLLLLLPFLCRFRTVGNNSWATAGYQATIVLLLVHIVNDMPLHSLQKNAF